MIKRKLFTQLLFVSSCCLLMTGSGCAADELQELHCEFFTISVPDEIFEISESVYTENGIRFYEPVSREHCGGFVAGIGVYSELAEYCDFPNFSREGGLIDSDGNQYDIVVSYPTDVQFDSDNPDAIDHYLQISDAMELIIDSITPAEGYTLLKERQADTTAVYDDVLSELCELADSKADAEMFEEAGYSRMHASLVSDNNTDTQIGYAFIDMNQDGYQELVLGSMNDEYDIIYDLFVWVNGSAEHVFSSRERDRFYIVADESMIREDGSSGASQSFTTYYLLDSNTAILSEQSSCIYDAERDADYPYFFTYGGLDEYHPASEEEWNRSVSLFAENEHIELHPIGDSKDQ